MNSKINGVPREVLELAAEYLKIHGERSSIECNTADDIQALLEAKPQSEPVVHLMFEDTFYGVNGPEVGDFDIQCDHEACEQLAKAFPRQQIALYPAPPELAELQATIVEEKAWRESAEGGWREASKVVAMQREKLDAQEAEIERLKSGQGEVAYWVDAYDNTITAKHKSYNEKLGGAPLMVVERYTTPLYAEQPAPVAVVLPERLDLPHRDEFESADQYAAATGEAKNWNACLDEVTRLNTK